MSAQVRAQVRILACTVKDIVFTLRVKRDIGGSKGFLIQGIRCKDVICMLDRPDVGTSFDGRLFLREVLPVRR